MEFLESSLRLSTPLLFAAMGGILCEKSGIATICLEGVMLVGAWVAAVVCLDSHSASLALLMAILAGGVFMSLHAFLCIYTKADAIISGLAVNLIAAGLAPVLTKSLFGSPTNTQSIPLLDRLQPFPIPGLVAIPIIGPFFNQLGLVYLAVLLPLFLHFFLFKTGIGLRILASGDGPEALRTLGVRPERVRYFSLFLGGMVTALGGAYLSIGHSSQFTRDMTSGRGFIALAALIFGKWRPLPTLFACLFFGLTDSLQIRMQSTPIFGYELPVQFIQLIPYVITLLVLVGFVGKARPPLAIGK